MKAIVDRRSVLLLNATYMPIQTITIREAVELMMRDVVLVVEGVAARLKTPTMMFEVPSIIRLKRYVNVPHRHASWSRRAVLSRDGYQCIFCGITPRSKQRGILLRHQDFTLDHIIPLSKGGRSSWGNTACACYTCNHRKANRTPHDAGMTMLWEPKTPRVGCIVARGSVPEEWKIYLQL
jgi:5-methylcytosine-specific restriction endonuclease McrA